MELEVRHLRALCAIADSGSVGRAATVLGYSQQALSGQLRRIEGYFGEPLFRRTASGVEPTRYGAEIVVRARDIVAGMDTIRRRPPSDDPKAHRPVRLACTNSPILPGMLVRLRDRLQNATANVTSVYASSDMVDLLERGELDAAIGVDYPGRDLRHSDAVAHRIIATEPTFLAMSAGHRLRHRVEVSLCELADDGWFLTPDDGAGWPGVFYEACSSEGFEPAAVHEFLGDPSQLQRMVADGLGVSPVQATIRPVPGVLVKPLVGTPLWCRYLLAWRCDGVSGHTVQALYSSATASYRELIARSPHFQAWVARGHVAAPA